MSAPFVRLQGVGKRFTKYDDRPTLVGALRFAGRTRRSKLWAIRDLDLELRAGESLGVLGRNGAGKSTLLQMLAGVTAPTVGRVEVRGRVAPLISVGVGFHPELTGRENVYVNGTVLGLSRESIERKFDGIVAFAELEKFIDTPVKFYSSGMFLRLGFAVAVEAEPEILLVDEILAVGDFAFQMKCHERMQQIRATGAAVVTVSHNLGALRSFCERGIVLQSGRLTYDGPIFDAIGKYHDVVALAGSDGDPSVSVAERSTVELVESQLVDDTGATVSHVRSGQPLRLRMTVRALQPIDKPFTGVVLGSESREVCIYSDSNVRDPHPPLDAGQVATYEATFTGNLPTGSYTVFGTLHRHVDAYRYVELMQTPVEPFYVTGRPLVGGLADFGARFRTVST